MVCVYCNTGSVKYINTGREIVTTSDYSRTASVMTAEMTAGTK